jgi:quercetin dioxygenase-like cupin family protein
LSINAMEQTSAEPASAAENAEGAEPEVAPGREIVNPISGERIIIRQSGAQTGGRLLVFDLYLPPGGHVPAGHAHPIQEERFIVVAGQMRFRLGRRAFVARPGETVIIPVGVAHWFGAAGGEAAQARVEVRPALRMQELFETTEAVSQVAAGAGVSRVGAWLARLTGLAQVALDYQREVAVPHVPASVVRVMLAPLAWLGRRSRNAARLIARGSERE